MPRITNRMDCALSEASTPVSNEPRGPGIYGLLSRKILVATSGKGWLKVNVVGKIITTTTTIIIIIIRDCQN